MRHCPFCGFKFVEEVAVQEAGVGHGAIQPEQSERVAVHGAATGLESKLAPSESASKAKGLLVNSPYRSRLAIGGVLAAVIFAVLWDRMNSQIAACDQRMELVRTDVSQARHVQVEQHLLEGRQCGAQWITAAQKVVSEGQIKEVEMGCNERVGKVEQHLKSSSLQTAFLAFKRMDDACRSTATGKQLSMALEQTKAAAEMAEIQVRRSLAQGDTVSAAAHFNRLVIFNREQPGIEQLRRDVLDSVKSKNSTR